MVILINNKKVMLDYQLANLLGLSTKVLNKGMKRLGIGALNKLTPVEFNDLKLKKIKIYSRPPKYYYFSDIKEYILNIKMNNKLSKKEIFYEKTAMRYLLKNKFVLVENQPKIMGKRPDFLVRKQNDIFIVEIQVGCLDYNHLYKIIAYRDLWKMAKGFEPRALLIAESIPKEYNSLLIKYELEFLAVPYNEQDEPPMICIRNKEELITQFLNYFN